MRVVNLLDKTEIEIDRWGEVVWVPARMDS